MDDMNEYLPIFLQESYDYINLLNNNLVLLEQDPSNKQALAEVFRAAHTLKGMSSTMGFQFLADAAHELESALQIYRDTHEPVDEKAIELGFRVLDYMQNQMKRIEVGESLEPFQVTFSNEASENGKRETTLEDTSSFALGAFEEEVVRVALEQGQKAAILEINLEQGVLMKGVRAFMVFKAIEDSGFEAISSQPDAESLEKEEFDLEFRVLVVGSGDLDSLKNKILRIAEVASVDVIEINLSEQAFPITADERHQQTSTKQPDSGEGTRNSNSSASLAQAYAASSAATAEQVDQQQQKKSIKNYIRVPEEHVNNLMSAISELVLEKAELELAIKTGNEEALWSLYERLSRSINLAQGEITALRMTPLSFVFERFPRMVRDLSRDLGKQIRFIMEGGDTEIDRTIIDRLGDPLVHLLRNAVDHGIEKPEDRIKAGKDPTGNVRLKAYHEGNNVYIVVEDDGAGIDTTKVLAKAVERGLVTADQASLLSQEEIFSFLFLPGFSTSDTVSEISGRGVGMDVLKNTVEELGGTVQVRSVLGKGTTVIMRLPLTMAIISALLVKVNGLIFALPLSVVEEISNDVLAVKETPQGNVLLLRGELLPVYSVAGLLNLPDDGQNNHIVVIRNGQKKAALLVAETVGKQEIVIKPLKSRFVPRYVDGATLLGDGTIGLVINTSMLLEGHNNVKR